MSRWRARRILPADEARVFNAITPVGARVAVRRDDGTTAITTTASEAFVLGGHTAVVQLDGISGCYLLARVSPVIGDAAPTGR